MFTPGVPRELRRMLEHQIIPRLLAKSGKQSAIYLKRFHSYGIGESHADTLLAGVASLAPGGSVKLGFRSHYPQLETKLTVRELPEGMANIVVDNIVAMLEGKQPPNCWNTEIYSVAS